MLASSVQNYSDPEHYETAFVGAKVEVLPSRAGLYSAHVTRIVFDRLWVARATESASCIKHAVQLPTRAFITFLTRPGPDLTTDGVEVPTIGLMRHSRGHSYHERSSGPTSWGVMSLPVEDIVAAGVAIAGSDLAPPRDMVRVTPAAATMARLQRLHAAAGKFAETAPDMVTHPEVAHAMEQSLVGAMVDCLRDAESRDETWAQRCHETIMRRFRRVLDENPDRALYIPEICAAIGVPDRTLRLCCQEHLGMGPKKYLLLRRLQLARRALRTADSNVTSVTEIATRYGFWHFSRFAGAYRASFGELPAATLKRDPI